MDKVYDQTMFRGATYATLKQRGRPLIAIGATDLSYGTPFLFTQDMFDMICSDLEQFPLSRAVAASNGFPGLFSPITLTSHARHRAGRKPDWVSSVTPAEMRDPLSHKADQVRMADRYLNPDKTRYLHLVDGGVADNLALRAAGGVMEVATVEDVLSRGLANVRRVLVISIDGQGTQDTSIAQQQMVGGLISLISQASGAQIDRYNFETLIAVGSQVERLAQVIARTRCGSAKVIDGAPCGDVKGKLIHISLAGMPPSAERDKLLAIPTGLTIPKADVDGLVKAGHDAVLASDALRDFLTEYQASARQATATARRK